MTPQLSTVSSPHLSKSNCVQAEMDLDSRLVILSSSLCLGLPGLLCCAVSQARGNARMALGHRISCSRLENTHQDEN